MRKYAYSIFFASLLALPQVGCGGGGGKDGGKALLSAFPDQGYAGRTTTLVLVGQSTNFSDASSVDFGEGVTVDSVTALGRTGLEVQVTAAVDATVGPRDVTVDGLTLPEGFQVASPTEAEVLGTPAQGSFSLLKVTNVDVLNPFDLTTDEEGNYVNLGVTVDGDGSASIASAGPFELELVLMMDVEAAAGQTQVEITSGPAEEAVVSRTSVEVAETTPVAIDGTGTIDGEVANGYDSVLYELTVAELSAAIVTPPTTVGDVAFPAIQVLGPSGSFEDVVGLAQTHPLFGPLPFQNNLGPAQTVYLIVWAGQSEAGYEFSFDFDAMLTASETIEHAEPNDASEEAQMVAAPGGVIGASFASETDTDWFAVDVKEEDVGQGILVATGGFSAADPVIEVFGPNGETALGEPVDSGWFDRTVSPATEEAGIHYVKISSSDYGPTIPEDSDYTVLIGFGDPPPPPMEDE